MTLHMSSERLTRVEVIDETGRAYVRWGVGVATEVQDEGRTLKVFVRAEPAVVDAKARGIAEKAAR